MFTMKKITRRNFLKVTAAVAAAGALAACGSSSSTASVAASSAAGASSASSAAASSAAAGTKGTIGYNQLVTGDFALDTLAGNMKRSIEAAGYTAQLVCANGAIDQMITDVENLIASGVDGLLLWLPVDSMYLTVAEKCEAANVPFVLADKVPTDSSIMDQLMTYKSFAGAVAPDNRNNGKICAKVANDNNWTKGLIIAPGIGDGTATPRIDAFKEDFKGTVLGEVHTDDANEAVTKTEDLYLANPDAEFFFCTGASTFGTAALTVLEKYDDHDTKIITCELDSTIIDSLTKDDYVVSDLGDYWICGYLGGVIITNFLSGTPITQADGSAPNISDVPAFTVTPAYVDFFEKHIEGDCIYSDEELQAMQGISLDDFEKIIQDYSLPERALAKYKEGTVTAAELDAMGVEHN